MIQKMKTSFTGIMLLSMFALLLVSCENEEELTSIVGNWYMYQQTEVETYEGETETWEWTYDQSLDVDFYGAQFLKFTDTKYIFYYNLPDGYEEDEDNYLVEEGVIIFTEDADTLNFRFEGDMVILSEKSENDDGSFDEYTVTLKQYDESLPPGSWTQTLADDNAEPDNSYDMATAISVGETTGFHTTTANDQDWFKFDATAGESYLIQVSGYVDGYMELYDTNGTTLIDEDDDNGSDVDVETSHDLNPVLLWNCDNSGTYYFMIKGFDEETTGHYKVTLTTGNLKNKYLSDGQAKIEKKQVGFRK